MSKIRPHTVSWTLHLLSPPVTNSNSNWMTVLKEWLDGKRDFHAERRLRRRQIHTRLHRFANDAVGVERDRWTRAECVQRIRLCQRNPHQDARAKTNVTETYTPKEHVVENSLLLAAMHISRHRSY